jgi:hypothetical protein
LTRKEHERRKKEKRVGEERRVDTLSVATTSPVAAGVAGDRDRGVAVSSSSISSLLSLLMSVSISTSSCRGEGALIPAAMKEEKHHQQY